MTKEEAALKQSDLEFAVDELNRELLDDSKDKISKENATTMIEELKAASEEIDEDDVFTKRTADVLRTLGVTTKFNIKKGSGSTMVTEKKASTKKTSEDTKGRKNSTSEVREFLVPLIEKAKFTKKELIEKCEVKFPDRKESSFSTILSDGKNKKYNKFDKLVQETKDGYLGF